MEVVRERKRRLFAYIMALAVLVYMNPAVMVKGAEATIPFTIRVTDGSVLDSTDWVEGSLAEGHRIYTKNYAEGDTIEITGKTPGGEGTHYIIEWTDYGNSANRWEDSKYTISASSPSDLRGSWGSYVKITYGDHIISEHSQKTYAGTNEDIDISLPTLSDEAQCINGKFYNNIWNVTANGYTVTLSENTAIQDFMNLLDSNTQELIIDISPDVNNYTETTVPETGGNFTLTKDTAYKLGQEGSSWTISDGDDDGCTYAGGIEFYVPEEATYTFTKK